jgi:hypothetical protein
VPMLLTQDSLPILGRAGPAHAPLPCATSPLLVRPFGARQAGAGCCPMTCGTSANSERCSAPPIPPIRQESPRLRSWRVPTRRLFASGPVLVPRDMPDRSLYNREVLPASPSSFEASNDNRQSVDQQLRIPSFRYKIGTGSHARSCNRQHFPYASLASALALLLLLLFEGICWVDFQKRFQERASS